MSSSDPSKKLGGLLKRLRQRFSSVTAEEGSSRPAWIEPLVDELVYSFLLWEATSGQARNAFKRLKDAYIDYNELRVSLPGETTLILGERYPRGEERSARLRATLFDLYKREYAVTLKSLADGAKRDVRTYLESLDGIPTFVVDRVMQQCFGAHAIPTDERLRDLMADEGVLDERVGAEDAATWLSRQIKSEDGGSVSVLLRAWADEDSPEPRKPKAPPSKPEPAAEEPRRVRAKNDAKADGKADSKQEGKGESRAEGRSEGKPDERGAKRKPATKKKAARGGEA